MPIVSAEHCGRLLPAMRGAQAALFGLVLMGSAAAQTGPDPVNNPKIDYFAPMQKDVDAQLPDTLPAIPNEAALRDFQAGATTSNRYAVDPASVLVRDLKVIQFTLVVTSSRGVRNITYEALHCERRESMLMAIGTDRGWTPLRSPRWRPVRFDDTLNSHLREIDRAWCEGGTAVAPARDLPGRLQSPGRQYIN